jgi:hypothetical protein
MNWKKHRFTAWIADDYRITESPAESDGYPFKLEVPGEKPAYFPTLEHAKNHADTLNQLVITRADNERLRNELARLRDGGTWEAHPAPEDFDTDLERPHATTDTLLEDCDPDGRGVPHRRITPVSPDADAIAEKGQQIITEKKAVEHVTELVRGPKCPLCDGTEYELDRQGRPRCVGCDWVIPLAP